MEKKIKKKELMYILEENYYALEVTGAQAMATIFEDYSQGRFATNLEEWNISPERLLNVINEMFDNWLNAGKMDVPAMSWLPRR